MQLKENGTCIQVLPLRLPHPPSPYRDDPSVTMPPCRFQTQRTRRRSSTPHTHGPTLSWFDSELAIAWYRREAPRHPGCVHEVVLALPRKYTHDLGKSFLPSSVEVGPKLVIHYTRAAFRSTTLWQRKILSHPRQGI